MSKFLILFFYHFYMTKSTLSRISKHIAGLMKEPGIARQYTPVQGLETLTEEKPWRGRIETGIPGTERMYGSEMIVLASARCAADCVACIRKNYSHDDVMLPQDLGRLTNYVGRERIKEVLITGGDPLTNPAYTLEIVDALSRTNIKHIRIGTSMLRADPKAVSNDFIAGLRRQNKVYGFIEVSPHFDHPAEFTEETAEKIKELNGSGIRLYTQTILLKGVNDNEETFRELAEKIRDNGMEWQYLYHCVPVSGNLHLRTSVEKGFELIDSLENHEEVTGRHPPKRYAIPLPIGKVYMDRSRIVEREGEHLWIETRYTLDSLRGNSMPSFCRQGKKGFLEVKYFDGKD